MSIIFFFSDFWIGYRKPSGDSNVRTVGGRIPTFSNLWATGADYTAQACVRLRYIGNDPNDDKFMYFSRWRMESCTDTSPEAICMDKAGE